MNSIVITNSSKARRIFNSGGMIVGYCYRESSRWKAVIFKEGPTNFDLNFTRAIIEKNDDIVFYDKTLKDLRTNIELLLKIYNWL